MIHVLLIAAENGVSVSSGGVDFTQVLQYGVLGLVTMALIFGRIVPWSYYDEKKVEIERLNKIIVAQDIRYEALRVAKENEIAALRNATEERIIPLAVRLLDIVERRPPPRGRS